MAAMSILLSVVAPLFLLQSVQYRSPAGVEYRAQRDTGAIARAESALAADPRSIDRFIALGVAQSGVRQYREAITTFTRGLAIAPTNAVLFRDVRDECLIVGADHPNAHLLEWIGAFADRMG